MSVASLTWADTASSSNTDYFNNQLTESNKVLPSDLSLLASEPISLSYSYDSEIIDYHIYSDIDTACYLLLGSGVRASRIEIFNYFDGNPEPRVTYSPDFFYDDGGFWQSSSSMIHTSYIIPVYMCSGGHTLVRVYYTGDISTFGILGQLHYPRYKMDNFSGLYTADDKKVNKNIDVRYFGDTGRNMIGLYQNVIYPSVTSCGVIGICPVNSNGIYKGGYQYTVRLKHSFRPTGIYLSGAVLDGDPVRDIGDIYSYYTFTPRYDVSADDVYFALNCNINPRAQFVGIDDITSSYIPASDTGQQGQTTAANTTVIKNVVTNISNTVSNISNQITNTTNTITNTITNTTNQIKEAVNQSANQISQTVTNTSNQIKDSVNQSAEKISQTVTNKVNEVNGTINSVGQKTQEKIDDMQKAVVDKLEDTKTGIITGIIDGLKSLFIPSDDFFKTWFDDMYSFFDERLGFLMLPVDLLVNLIDMVVSADSSNAGIPFPEIKWEGTVLIPAQTVRIEIFDTDFGKDLQDKLYFVGNVIMIGALLSLMYRKFEEVLRS